MLLPYRFFLSRELGQTLAFFSHPWGSEKSISSDLKIETGRFPQRPGTTLEVGEAGFHLQLGEGYSNTTFKHTPFHGITNLKWQWLCSWGVFNKNIGSIWIYWQQKCSKKHKDSLWKNLSYGTGLLTKNLHVSQWFSDVMMVSQRFVILLDLFVCIYIYVAMGVNKLRIIKVPTTN